MRIAFRDFVPASSGGLFNHKTESLEEVVVRANQWTQGEGVDVINVETVAIPSARGDSEDVQVQSNAMPTWWHYVVRVWFRPS